MPQERGRNRNQGCQARRAASGIRCSPESEIPVPRRDRRRCPRRVHPGPTVSPASSARRSPVNDGWSPESDAPLPEASPAAFPAGTSSGVHASSSAESADAWMESCDRSCEASSARFGPAPADGAALPCPVEREPDADCADRAVEARCGVRAADCCFPAAPLSRFRPRRRTLPLTADSVTGGPRASATSARVHPASQSSVSFLTRSGVHGVVHATGFRFD